MKTTHRKHNDGFSIEEKTSMKYEYQKPEIEIIILEGKDVITESDGNIVDPCWAYYDQL